MVLETLEDLPRLVFIDEECDNLKAVVDDRELTRNIYKSDTSGHKRKTEKYIFFEIRVKCIDPLSILHCKCLELYCSVVYSIVLRGIKYKCIVC